MSPIPSMPYEILWGERVIRSIANLTRRDGEEFMDLAARVPFDITVAPHPLAAANAVLQRLRQGDLTGAAVLVPDA
jgi:alcohol dehydrogenase, propanol-preferring